MVKYTYEKFGVKWEREIDPATVSENVKLYGISRGIHEALKDTFAGIAVAEGYSESDAAADFVAGLDKKFQQVIDGTLPEYVPGGRGAGQPKDERSEMIARVCAEGVRKMAKGLGKKLPKVASDEYKAIFAKFLERNADKIAAEADKRLKAQAKIEYDATGIM
jgi:hypothetical protein